MSNIEKARELIPRLESNIEGVMTTEITDVIKLLLTELEREKDNHVISMSLMSVCMVKAEKLEAELEAANKVVEAGKRFIDVRSSGIYTVAQMATGEADYHKALTAYKDLNNLNQSKGEGK